MADGVLVAELNAERQDGIEVGDVLVEGAGQAEGRGLKGGSRLPAIEDGHALTGIKTRRGEHHDEGEPVTPRAEGERGHGDLGHPRRSIDERGYDRRDVG